MVLIMISPIADKAAAASVTLYVEVLVLCFLFVTLSQWDEIFCKGAFNNYGEKKGGRGGQPKVPAWPPRGGGPLNVHVDQNLDIPCYFVL